MQVSKWGNSYAVRLPAALLAEMNIDEDDNIRIILDEGGGLKICKVKSLESRIDELRKIRAKLPKNYKFDRDEANAR